MCVWHCHWWSHHVLVQVLCVCIHKHIMVEFIKHAVSIIYTYVQIQFISILLCIPWNELYT